MRATRRSKPGEAGHEPAARDDLRLGDQLCFPLYLASRLMIGAYLAAKEAGRTMKFVGIDALPHEGVEYVKQGILDATFLYPTGGADAIETALQILHGGAVPKKIVLGTRIFTKENAASGGEAIP